jgi:hypothetical protein
LNNALDRLARNNDWRAGDDLRSRIDARIRNARNNYVKLPYAAAVIVALGILGALQIHRAHQRTLAEQSNKINIEYLNPSNMLYNEQD